MHIITHRIITFNEESIHRGAPRPCGARPKAAPMLSWSSLRILGLKRCIPCLSMCILCVFGLIFWIILILPYLCPPPHPHPSQPVPPWSNIQKLPQEILPRISFLTITSKKLFGASQRPRSFLSSIATVREIRKIVDFHDFKLIF